MNTSSKTILLTVLIMSISLPSIDGGNTPVNTCMKLADVGNACSILNQSQTCGPLTNGQGTTYICCNTGLDPSGAAKLPECKCCPSTSNDCKNCIALTRSFNISSSHGNI
ncbi:unnamed protein product [Orchesella dallaii]|uniref:Uncharacterized protein n=1 Tax=Orchesella dallaii TaxID=48710 RepID=A0ABP1PKP9_9HEXA